MAKKHLIEKSEVMDIILDYYDVLDTLKKHDQKHGTHKLEKFSKALECVYWNQFNQGYKLLDRDTFEDGRVAEVYRRIYYFLLKIGVIEDDD